MNMKKVHYVIFLLLLTFTVQAQTTNYQVYSLYVVNIAKYSSWPTVNGEFNITVFGKSKVYDELLKQEGKNVNGRAIKVKHAETIGEIGDAQIIYLPDGRSGALDEIIKNTEGKSIMIISEREGLHKKGAGFSFVVMENGTLRCDINSTDLEKRQIKLSKNLSAFTNSSI